LDTSERKSEIPENFLNVVLEKDADGPSCEKNKMLQRVEEERNILQTLIRRKANSVGHIWHKNCLLKHIIEGKMDKRIEMAGR
jgi:hypothetical protein